MKWGYIRKEDIYKDGIHTKRRHTWKEDIYGVEILIEWEYAWSRDTYGVGIHGSGDIHGVGTHTEWRKIRKGHIWSRDIWRKDTHKVGTNIEREHTKTHRVRTYTERGQIWRWDTQRERKYTERKQIRKRHTE